MITNMSCGNGFQFDEVFIAGVVGEDIKKQARQGSSLARAIACASALSAWANCMAGSKVPEKFGFGMLALANLAGLSARDLQPENAKKNR